MTSKVGKRAAIVLLIAVFILSGIVWLAMNSYQRRIEREYEAGCALHVSEILTQNGEKRDADPEAEARFREVFDQYWNIHSRSWFRRLKWDMGEIALLSGSVLFLLGLTLLRRGIVWLAGRRVK